MLSLNLVLPLVAILAVSGQLFQSATAANAQPELSYALKCFHGLDDCSLIESIPDAVGDEGSMIKKRSVNEEADSHHAKLQKVVKKFFASTGEAHKVFKTEEINCLTGDCRVLTAKISKNNFPSLETFHISEEY